MSLLSCDLKWEEEARIEQTRREWRAIYSALLSNIADGPREILMGAPYLAPYQPHPKDSAALIAEFWPKRIVGTNFWDVELRYSTDVDIVANPLAMSPVITIDSVKRELPALFDSNGNPIINLAGDFYTDPQSTKTVTDLVFKVSKNVPLNLPAWITAYPDCVNSDAVTIRGLTCPPGTLYFGALSVGAEENISGTATSTSTLVQGTPYTTVSFELDFRRDGWTILLPNWGYFQLVPRRKTNGSSAVVANDKTGKKQTIRTRGVPAGYDRQRIIINGDYPPHPQFLDAQGALILNPTFDQIITLEYDLHDKLPFGGVLPLK